MKLQRDHQEELRIIDDEKTKKVPVKLCSARWSAVI